MRRVFVICWVLLSMLWQATAVAGPMVFAGSEGDGEHALLHWQEAGHHHHGDGDSDLHEDDSVASKQHVLLDDALSSPALYTAQFQLTVDRSDNPLLIADERPTPSPFVEGLRRPPRHTL